MILCQKLLVFVVAVVLKHCNRASPIAVVEFIQDQVFRCLSESDSLPYRFLPVGELSYELEILTRLHTAKAIVTQSDPFIAE